MKLYQTFIFIGNTTIRWLCVCWNHDIFFSLYLFCLMNNSRSYRTIKDCLCKLCTINKYASQREHTNTHTYIYVRNELIIVVYYITRLARRALVNIGYVVYRSCSHIVDFTFQLIVDLMMICNYEIRMIV